MRLVYSCFGIVSTYGVVLCYYQKIFSFYLMVSLSKPCPSFLVGDFVCRLKYPYRCFPSHFCFRANFFLLILMLFVLFLVAVISLPLCFFILNSSRCIDASIYGFMHHYEFSCSLVHLFKFCPRPLIIIIIRVFHISVSRWFFTGVWVTAILLKSPGLFSVFWPFSIMLSFGWSPLVRQLPSPPLLLLLLYYFLRVFHTCITWWFLTGDLVTVSPLKSPGLFAAFWPTLIMLQSGWSPLVLRFLNLQACCVLVSERL